MEKPIIQKIQPTKDYVVKYIFNDPKLTDNYIKKNIKKCWGDINKQDNILVDIIQRELCKLDYTSFLLTNYWRIISINQKLNTCCNRCNSG